MNMIEVSNLTHIYMRDTPFEVKAVNKVSLKIESGEVIGIVGPTGCGKSTLIQHFNALLKPSSGKVIIDGIDISSKNVDLMELRKKVGLVFQYPEHQLFEENVFNDVAFGPKNLGFSIDEIEATVKESLEFMDLPYEKIKNRSPFFLSGGEMRRVALAGVLAMKPQVLVLDEPTAGLDPMGKKRLLEKLKQLQLSRKTTIIIVSHSMEEIVEICNRVIVMKSGEILLSGSLKEIFSKNQELQNANVLLPQYTKLMIRLKEEWSELREDVFTLDDSYNEIMNHFRKG